MTGCHELTQRIYDALGCTEPLTLRIIDRALEVIATFDRKQHDYGSTNISAFGETGVIVRCHDKLARLRNLSPVLNPGRGDAANESRDDSWLDLATYSLIALVVNSGEWPGVEGDGVKSLESRKDGE